ncbi:WD40 repeat domain-containing protein [Candidatus Dependentiae bacterium]
MRNRSKKTCAITILFMISICASKACAMIVASGHIVTKIHVYQLGENNIWKQIQILTNAPKPIRSLAVSPDGNMIASCGRNQVALWQRDEKNVYKRVKKRYNLPDHLIPFLAKFSKEGDLYLFLKNSRKQAIDIFQLMENKKFEKQKSANLGKEYNPKDCSIDGKVVAATTLIGKSSYVAMLGKTPQTFKAYDKNVASSLSLNKDNSLLATAPAIPIKADHSRKLKIWNLHKKMETKGVAKPFKELEGALKVAFNPDSTFLVSSEKLTIKIWDAKTWEKKYEFTASGRTMIVSVAMSSPETEEQKIYKKELHKKIEPPKKPFSDITIFVK